MKNVLMAGAALVVSATAGAATIHVDLNATGSPDGQSWATAYVDLHDALATAQADDNIWVAAGTYVPGSARTDTFLVPTDVSVYGGFAATETTQGERDIVANVTVLSGEIAGDNCYHVVEAEYNTRIDGFTISGGQADGASANDDRGGGVCALSQLVVVANCILERNSATYGGAVRGTDRIFLSKCVVRWNDAAAFGGGLFAEYTYDIDVRVRSCVFAENSAAGGGGAIWGDAPPLSYSASLEIRDTTFVRNVAPDAGAVHYGFGLYGTCSSSIFRDNSATSNRDINLSSSNAELLYCCVQQSGLAGTNGNIGVDPLFMDEANGNFALAEGSPCIDAGLTEIWSLGTDIEGNEPYDDPTVANTGADTTGGTEDYRDMGACEYPAAVGAELTPREPPDGDGCGAGAGPPLTLALLALTLARRRSSA